MALTPGVELPGVGPPGFALIPRGKSAKIRPQSSAKMRRRRRRRRSSTSTTRTCRGGAAGPSRGTLLVLRSSRWPLAGSSREGPVGLLSPGEGVRTAVDRFTAYFHYGLSFTASKSSKRCLVLLTVDECALGDECQVSWLLASVSLAPDAVRLGRW